MIKSRYTYMVNNDKHTLLFNGMKATSVVLTNEEYQKYLNDSLDQETMESLSDLGFYVEDNYNELDELMFRSKLAVDKDRRRFYRIYTTLCCNARCPYCFEKGTKQISLDQKTADDLVKFIDSTSIQNEDIIIEWFGGEPLVNEKMIDYLSKKINKIAKLKKSPFYSRMITNGYLLDAKKIKKAKSKWKLKFVQITLDGLKNTYEKIKGFKSKDAFEKVINNIKLLLKANIFVNIRLNYDEKNIDEILKLIDYLVYTLKDFSNYNIYAKKIMYDDQDNSVIGSEEMDLIILKKLLDVGAIKNIMNSIPQRLNTCVANMLNSYMILPDGRIAKCSQSAGQFEYVGDIINGCEPEKLVKWCTPRLPQKCLDCKLVAQCNGGCLFERFRNKNYCFLSEKILLFKLKYFLDNVFEKENYEIQKEKR